MGIPKERFSIVPNGAAMPQASRGVEPDPYLIVSSGRLERYKGHHRVIEAMPELIRRVPAARLRVVGKGPYEEELHKLVNRLGLRSHVTIEFVPGAERQKMADLLARAGLVVLFSEYEAHPVAIMEALSLRRPVLVADTSGLGEIARNGLCRALSLEAGPQELATAMAEELSARRVVPDLALPDWDACAQALSEIYRDVVIRRLTAHLPSDGAMPSWTSAEGA